MRFTAGRLVLLAFLAGAFDTIPLTLRAEESTVATGTSAPAFHEWALRPPMGWNSWDCFATTVTEAQTRAQASMMAAELARYGWQYIVVDIQWYEPQAKGFDYRVGATLTMDGFGRLWPATNRFPSSANGAGFKPLADAIHGQGLKFGVHLLRGIPRQAVRENTPIQGATAHATDIADKSSTCAWNTDMYGVDMTKPGAQEYYNSVFALFAAWDVDFVKVDDLSRPYHRAEIEGIRKAIDHSGRAMVLSLSPGETPLNAGAHVSQNANIWRVSDDFWDKWPLLLEQFERLRKWTEFRGPGHFPDADMLPLGIISMGKPTHFTPPEQYTLMTLWCIARSPLIFGGDLTKLDDFTRKLITNPEVLAVDQNSTGNRQLFCKDGLIAWVADVPNSKDKYLALFNTRSGEQGKAAGEDAQILVDLAEFGFHERAQARDLWSHKDLGMITNQFAQSIPSHGAGLFRFSPAGERAALPTIFLIGDSTVNNSTKGLQGWGAPLPAFFDTNKVIILNRARGGRSSRTYFTEGLWDQVRQQLKPGDFVLMQFGHNDGGSLTSNRARASLKGVGDESQEVLIEATGKPEVVHTYGWYLRKYVNETKAQGATPIVLTPVPRNMWKDGKVNRSAGDYGGWAAEVAKKEGVENIDLNEIVARHYEAEGQSNVLAKYFTAADHTHTTPDGAKLSAVCVVEGIKGLKESTLKGLLTTQKP